MWKSGWKINTEQLRKRETWLVLLAAGILLLLWGSGPEPEKPGEQEKEEREEYGEPEETGNRKELQNYEKETEKRVRELLRGVEGAGEVDVMIRLSSSPEKVMQVLEDRSRSVTEETDSGGGIRKICSESVRETAPDSVLLRENEPAVEGIVICMEGGGSARLRAEVTEAMEALFDVPAHKIKVLKRVR